MNNYNSGKSDTLLIVLLIISLITLFCITLNNSKRIESLEKDLNSSLKKIDSLKEDNNYLNSINSTNSNSNSNVSNEEETTTEDETYEADEVVEIDENTKKKETKYTKKDKEVIEYFKSVSEDVDNLDSKSESKAKGVFIGIVDFLFYDGEVNGIKFKELSNDGKKKVLGISSDIDYKLDSKFPNYKDRISTKTREAFNKASEIIRAGSEKVSNFSREKLGSENYNEIIKNRDELLYYYKSAKEIIGNTAGKITTSIVGKIKAWYENFRN